MNSRSVKTLKKIYLIKKKEKIPKAVKKGWNKLSDYEKEYLRGYYE